MAASKMRRSLRSKGWQARRLWCANDEGGMTLVKRWRIVHRSDPLPRAGELQGGHLTREEAWLAFEDAQAFLETLHYGIGLRSGEWEP